MLILKYKAQYKFKFKSQRNCKEKMDTIELPEIWPLAIDNLPISGRPIWRLTEGKHIVKLGSYT